MIVTINISDGAQQPVHPNDGLTSMTVKLTPPSVSTSGSRQRAPPPRGGTWNLTRDREKPVPKFKPTLVTMNDLDEDGPGSPSSVSQG